MRCTWVALLLIPMLAQGQMIQPRAHAHNDYEHNRPLLDALSNGFRSVEVDVHLVGDRLYVGHNQPEVRESRSLEKLYLNPLDSLARDESSRKALGSLTLLVDIKTDATRTLQRLVAMLVQYPQLVTPSQSTPLISVVISGNRDYDQILNAPFISIDGRPGDLGKGYSTDKMPLISDHYRRWMRWSGKGSPDADELEKLRDLARRVHAENKKLRLWAIPDNEEAWSVLLDAGVDLINTDRLADLSAYLSKRKKAQPVD